VYEEIQSKNNNNQNDRVAGLHYGETDTYSFSRQRALEKDAENHTRFWIRYKVEGKWVDLIGLIVPGTIKYGESPRTPYTALVQILDKDTPIHQRVDLYTIYRIESPEIIEEKAARKAEAADAARVAAAEERAQSIASISTKRTLQGGNRRKYKKRTRKQKQTRHRK